MWRSTNFKNKTDYLMKKLPNFKDKRPIFLILLKSLIHTPFRANCIKTSNRLRRTSQITNGKSINLTIHMLICANPRLKCKNLSKNLRNSFEISLKMTIFCLWSMRCANKLLLWTANGIKWKRTRVDLVSKCM
jgi:hypothetical protein